MSSPQEKLFATTAARAAAFPVLAGRLVAGFSELARLNLSMYGDLLAGAQNTRDSILPSQTLGVCDSSRTGGLPPFAFQFFAPPGAALEMTLQASTSLYQLALEGYVETVRGATAAIAAATRSLGLTGAMAQLPIPVPDRSACTVIAPPPDVPAKGMESVSRKTAKSVALT